jgi:hypothetical protein
MRFLLEGYRIVISPRAAPADPSYALPGHFSLRIFQSQGRAYRDTGDLSMNIDINFYDFNKPVKIVLPKEAKSAILLRGKQVRLAERVGFEPTVD